MTTLPRPPLVFLLALAAVLVTLALPRARAEDEPANPAREALEKAIARGKALWSQNWGEGTKACVECHAQGANRMRSTRLKAYPKYDFGLARVVSGQEKLNHMLETQCKTTQLPLGHEDLTALEAFISTIR